MHGCKLRIESNIIERIKELFDGGQGRCRDGRKGMEWMGWEGENSNGALEDLF